MVGNDETPVVVIYWDDQDPKNTGWAWRYYRASGQREVESGELGPGYSSPVLLEHLRRMTDDELLALYEHKCPVARLVACQNVCILRTGEPQS